MSDIDAVANATEVVVNLPGGEQAGVTLNAGCGCKSAPTAETMHVFIERDNVEPWLIVACRPCDKVLGNDSISGAVERAAKWAARAAAPAPAPRTT